MRMIYKNHRGETSVRSIVPHGVSFHEDNRYHGKSFILGCVDVDKREIRDFKLDDCDFLSAQSPALTSVILERAKQIEKYGYTVKKDRRYRNGELAKVGICYAIAAANSFDKEYQPRGVEFPWSQEHWKPEAPRRENLVKAVALLLAQIDQIDAANGV